MLIGTVCGEMLISAIDSHGRKVQPLFPELFDLLLPTSQILTAGVPSNVRNEPGPEILTILIRQTPALR